MILLMLVPVKEKQEFHTLAFHPRCNKDCPVCITWGVMGICPTGGRAGCLHLWHGSDYSHIIGVHSMGHISTDHVGLGHCLLEGCQVVWRCRDPAQHQLR